MTAGIASAWCTRPGARKNRRPTATARRSKLSRRNLTTTIPSSPTSSLTSLLNSTRLRPAQTAEYYVTLDDGSPTPAQSCSKIPATRLNLLGERQEEVAG